MSKSIYPTSELERLKAEAAAERDSFENDVDAGQATEDEDDGDDLQPADERPVRQRRVRPPSDAYLPRPDLRAPLHESATWRQNGTGRQAYYSDAKPRLIDFDALLSYVVYVLIGVIIGTLAFLFFYLPNSADKQVAAVIPSNATKLFVGELKTLSHLFPNQDGRIWLHIRAAVRSVWDADARPLQPAVVLLVASPNSVMSRDCLVSKIASAAVQSQSFAGMPAVLDLGSLRRSADKDIRAQFDHGLRVLVMQRIDRISSSPVFLLLHSYCDTTGAPFKDALILLTADMQYDVYVNEISELQPLLERHLTALWQNAGQTDEKSAALLARVANNVVFVRHERELIC